MVTLAWGAAVAAAATVQIVVEPPELSQGQTGGARVLVSLSGREHVDTSRPPPLPTGNGLRARFTGQMVRQQRVNLGAIQRVVEFRYDLTAVAPGTWTVGPVELVPQGATVPAVGRAVPLVVTDRPPEKVEEVSVFADFLADGRPERPTVAWEGEVVLFRRGIKTRLQGLRAGFTDPELQGVRTLQHGEPVESQYKVEDATGTVVVTETLVPLVASGGGTHELGVVTARVQVPVGSSRFGFREVRTEIYASEPLSIEVKPLPPPPPGFTGLVGDLTVRASVPPGPIRAGDSVPFTLVLSGPGFLEGAKLPDPVIPGVAVYPSEPELKAVVQNGAFFASGTWKWALVPTEAGELALPPQDLVVFSPAKGAYETLHVELPVLTVQEGRDGDGAVHAFGNAPAGVAVEDDGTTPRPPYAWGVGSRFDLVPWLVPAAVLALAPALGSLGLDGARAVAERLRRRRPVRVDRPPTARELLADLPAAPAERLAVLDHALRTAEVGREGDPRFRDLRKRLGRARFGGGPPDPTLEDDLRALCEIVEREAA